MYQSKTQLWADLFFTAKFFYPSGLWVGGKKLVRTRVWDILGAVCAVRARPGGRRSRQPEKSAQIFSRALHLTVESSQLCPYRQLSVGLGTGRTCGLCSEFDSEIDIEYEQIFVGKTCQLIYFSDEELLNRRKIESFSLIKCKILCQWLHLWCINRQKLEGKK